MKLCFCLLLAAALAQVPPPLAADTGFVDLVVTLSGVSATSVFADSAARFCFAQVASYDVSQVAVIASKAVAATLTMQLGFLSPMQSTSSSTGAEQRLAFSVEQLLLACVATPACSASVAACLQAQGLAGANWTQVAPSVMVGPLPPLPPQPPGSPPPSPPPGVGNGVVAYMLNNAVFPADQSPIPPDRSNASQTAYSSPYGNQYTLWPNLPLTPASTGVTVSATFSRPLPGGPVPLLFSCTFGNYRFWEYGCASYCDSINVWTLKVRDSSNNNAYQSLVSSSATPSLNDGWVSSIPQTVTHTLVFTPTFGQFYVNGYLVLNFSLSSSTGVNPQDGPYTCVVAQNTIINITSFKISNGVSAAAPPPTRPPAAPPPPAPPFVLPPPPAPSPPAPAPQPGRPVASGALADPTPCASSAV